MRLLNEISPDERRWHDWWKPFCQRCGRRARKLLDRKLSVVTWTGVQQLPPRRFLNAKIRVIEEIWLCPDCPKAREHDPEIGRVIDFEHIGRPEEIVDD